MSGAYRDNARTFVEDEHRLPFWQGNIGPGTCFALFIVGGLAAVSFIVHEVCRHGEAMGPDPCVASVGVTHDGSSHHECAPGAWLGTELLPARGNADQPQVLFRCQCPHAALDAGVDATVVAP